MPQHRVNVCSDFQPSRSVQYHPVSEYRFPPGIRDCLILSGVSQIIENELTIIMQQFADQRTRKLGCRLSVAEEEEEKEEVRSNTPHASTARGVDEAACPMAWLKSITASQLT